MSQPRTCPRCGASLPPEVPPESCPRCLLSLGMKSDSGASAADTLQGHAASPAPSPEDLAPYFPQLEIQELLGRGGMGIVYKARQKSLNRPVALKILSIAPEAGEVFAERFSREAKALASLAHPNIVTIHDFGMAGGRYYLIMELIEGRNLREAMRAGEITSRQALAVVAQVCEALQFAHDAGIVHRDIKPENILINARGEVKIADFGLAKILGIGLEAGRLTGSNQAMGTAHYMAPEQIEHPKEVDHRADLYSLGVVFYELLTGELPLGRFDPPSRKIGIDVRLDEVVLKALEKEPPRRYQAANQIKTDVEHISQHPGAEEMTVPGVGAITDGRLRVAGWASILDAVLQIPAAVLYGLVGGSWLSGQRQPDLALAWIVVHLTLSVLFVFIYTSLRRMFSERLRFDRANWIIVALIGVFVVWFLGDTISFLSPVLDVPSIVFTVIIWFALGIGYVALGIQLLKLRRPSPRLIAALAWAAIITGIFTASILLVLGSVPGVIVLDIFLAILFFRVAGATPAGVEHTSTLVHVD